MAAGTPRFFKYGYVHMTAFPFELMIAMMHMIGEGVFDRFPRLRVGFMEGGAGWLPFWMERLDEHVEKLAPQMPNLRRRPSEIIRSEQIVLTCESEESGLDRVLEAAGGGGRNAVEFFGLANLPGPNALKVARPGWTREESREVAAAQGALR